MDIQFQYNGQLTLTVNGKVIPELETCEGIRRKFKFEVDGKTYFVKADYGQTKLEIETLQKVEPSEASFFLPIVAHGSLSFPDKYYPGEMWTIHYIVQEFVEFHTPEDLKREGWRQIAPLLTKYDLSWDVKPDFRNWAFVGDRPVIYDAVPNY